MKITTNHPLRPEHLNHHYTLYGGQITFWLTESAFLASAQLWGSSDHLVMAAANNIQITRPMRCGDILSLTSEVVRLGTTSLFVHVQGCDLLSQQSCCRGDFVFVTVDDAGHKMPHHLTLPQ